MKNYHMEVNQDTHGKWMVEVRCNSDTLVCYGQIDSQDDAYLVGEAFIDGIKLIEGE
jgi:hypothetical protein